MNVKGKVMSILFVLIVSTSLCTISVLLTDFWASIIRDRFILQKAKEGQTLYHAAWLAIGKCMCDMRYDQMTDDVSFHSTKLLHIFNNSFELNRRSHEK